MVTNYADTAQSYKVAGQAPLDAKYSVNTIQELIDLGVDDEKAFTYYRGMTVFLQEEKKLLIWTDNIPNGVVGYLPTNFTYPPNSEYDGIIYSGLEFNFIPFMNIGPVGPAGQNGTNGTNGTNGQNGLSAFQIAQQNGFTGTVQEWLESLIGPEGPSGGIITTPSGAQVLEAIIPFNRAQLLNNSYKLTHNLYVERYIEEHFSYPITATNQRQTLSVSEMISNGNISNFIYLNPNEVVLDQLVNLNSSVNDNDIIYYIVRYIGAVQGITFNVPNKSKSLNYDSSQSNSNNSYGFPLTELTSGMINSTGLPVGYIQIDILPATGELALNGIPVFVGQLVSIADINAGKLRFWMNGNVSIVGGGDYQTDFSYIVIDTAGHQSNVVNFHLDVTDIVVVQITVDSPLSKNIIFTPGEPQIDKSDKFSLSEIIVNYYNSMNFALAGIKIYSLVNRGSLALSGQAIAVSDVISVADLSANNFEFFAKGLSDTDPDGNFITSFQYKAIDINGHESNLVDFNIKAKDSNTILSVVLSKSGNDFTATISDGFADYDYEFFTSASGSPCADFEITDPIGVSNIDIITKSSMFEDNHTGANYEAYVVVTDAFGNTATSNIITFGSCLIEGTKIITVEGVKNIEDLVENELILDKNNSFTKVTSITRTIAAKVININNGLLVSTESHIHMVKVNNELIQKHAYELSIDDILVDKNNVEIIINSLVEIEENTNVVNISTISGTYYANDVLTHNKIPCPL
jgi:hypothetical protein